MLRQLNALLQSGLWSVLTSNGPGYRHKPTAAWISSQLGEASRLVVCEIGNELYDRTAVPSGISVSTKVNKSSWRLGDL
jgi:hypothetical protein